uniref:B-cell translocation gene 3 n=1 Tax=Gouania willdenowi TaxID=441366 RepID=A0A8C5ELA7_GOUWI
MKSEIAAVVSFLKRLVELKNKVEVEKMDLFAERLTVELQEKFEGHWVREKPSKGQAYRCIRVNAFHKYDPELLRACRESGVHYGDLGLPWEMTLWVDPGEVCGSQSINSIHSGQTKLMFIFSLYLKSGPNMTWKCFTCMFWDNITHIYAFFFHKQRVLHTQSRS